MADTGNSRIQVLDARFNHLMDITGDGQGRGFLCASRVAVNTKGEIIVSDFLAKRVLVYDESGAYSRELLTGDWDGPCGIAVDGDDTLYIVAGGKRIKVINKAGQELRTIRDAEHSVFGFFSCITIYKNQLLVCGNGQLYQVDKMGSSCTKLDYVQSARGVAVDNSGDLVIVDDKRPVTVVRDGRVVLHVGEQGQQPWLLGGPLAVAVTKTGEIVVTSFSDGNLLVYNC